MHSSVLLNQGKERVKNKEIYAMRIFVRKDEGCTTGVKKDDNGIHTVDLKPHGEFRGESNQQSDVGKKIWNVLTDSQKKHNIPESEMTLHTQLIMDKNEPTNTVRITISGWLVSELFYICKMSPVFEIAITDGRNGYQGTRYLSADLHAIRRIRTHKGDNGFSAYGSISCSSDMEQLLMKDDFWAGFTISIYLFSGSHVISMSDVISEDVNINRKILSERIATDVELVSSNNILHPCHKVFLQVHSPVFTAMLKNDMEESKTNKIETDMASETVTALLSYLYTWDIEQPSKHAKIALDLFQAGHRYDISSLERKMSTIILESPSCWFTVDDAFQLYYFVRNLDEYKNLQRKAVVVLKPKYVQLEYSTEFQILLKRERTESIQIMGEIFKLILSSWNSDKPDS